RQIATAEMQSLNQTRLAIHPHLKAVLQRAVAEGFVYHRTAQTVQLPRQQRAGGVQVKDGTQRGVSAGENNGVLRQPLQRGLFVEVKMLTEAGQRAVAAIELTGAGHGDEGMAFGVEPHGNIQRISAHNSAWRVQQVKVAGFPFGIKRTLNGERPAVTRGMEEGFLRGMTKLEGKRGLPAFV